MESIIVSIISGVLSGILVAFVNNLLIRSKTQAETEKLMAEAERIRLENEKMKADFTSYVLKEETLYDGSKGIQNYDVTMTTLSGNKSLNLLAFDNGNLIINSPYAEMDLTKSPRWLRICNP